MKTVGKGFSQAQRRDVIRGILNAGAVGGQIELQRELAKRGFDVTQSSVSRDLRELNVVKIGGKYVLPDAESGAYRDHFSAAADFVDGASRITSLMAAGPNLLVVRVPPGRAPALAVALDQANWNEVVGCIAGDDTIFIAVRNRNELVRVKQRLEKAKRNLVNATR